MAISPFGSRATTSSLKGFRLRWRTSFKALVWESLLLPSGFLEDDVLNLRKDTFECPVRLALPRPLILWSVIIRLFNYNALLLSS